MRSKVTSIHLLEMYPSFSIASVLRFLASHGVQVLFWRRSSKLRSNTSTLSAWRMTGRGRTRLAFHDDRRRLTVRAMTAGGHYMLRLPDRRVRVIRIRAGGR